MTDELTDNRIAAFKTWLQDELTHSGRAEYDELCATGLALLVRYGDLHDSVALLRSERDLAHNQFIAALEEIERLRTPPDRTHVCSSCGDIAAHLALARESALNVEIERLNLDQEARWQVTYAEARKFYANSSDVSIAATDALAAARADAVHGVRRGTK